jgi:hypothetical protein
VTALSPRASKERIIAVEMLRGPDHIAIRTAGGESLVADPLLI